MIEKVHVIFKTHLDIGFTEMADQVREQYKQLYIPKAIQLAKQLEADGGQARFIWTTGSWLIHEYMKSGESCAREMEEAIEKGYIRWHGLPFTTHTELLDASLFSYSLTLSEKLDSRFGMKTISAKMTDVPGHSRSIIAHMAKNGIQYLHLGVNPASKVPAVPELFVWKGADGSDLIVNYADNYGNVLELDGLKDAMVFAHTGDNCGPPSAEEIKLEFARLAERFPGAEIVASTMDAFAEKLQPLKHLLPVVHEEIGDTWIHGSATDPKKIAQFRELLRLRRKWLAEGRMDINSHEHGDFSDNLLLIAEHTWGLDEKKFLLDFKNYSLSEFQAARTANIVSEDAITAKYAYIGAFAMNEFDQLSQDLYKNKEKFIRTYTMFESSWSEQRAYLTKATDALSAELRQEALDAIAALEPQQLDIPTDSMEIPLFTPVRLGQFTVQFGEDGSLLQLCDQQGKSWADDQHRLGQFVYETFGPENYHHWFERYVENIGVTYSWADADFGKPGFENLLPVPRHVLYAPRVVTLVRCEGEEADRVFVSLKLPALTLESFGAPADVHLEYVFSKQRKSVEVTLSWFGKQANRLPEAIWFSFAPKVNNSNLWKLDKMGEWISPLEVVKDGNRNLHGVQKGIVYDGAEGRLMLETLDAPLVAPGRRRLLQFDNTFAPLEEGFHYLLYNNVWGTNFPMWYEGNDKFRFVISLS